jgi:hypothetical protein
MGRNREPIDLWPVAEAGLARRVARSLQANGITTMGELRARAGGRIPRCGKSASRHIAWFFALVDRNKTGTPGPSDVRSWLGELLSEPERFVVEQRYGLDDPLFRPTMKRLTLAEIGEARGGLTRERVRQVLRRALEKLRSRLGRALAEPLLAACRRQMGEGKVLSVDLRPWRGVAWLGGYEPWGALLLLAETGNELACDGLVFEAR